MSDVKIVVSAQDQASRVLDTVRGSMERVRGATDLVAAGLGLVGIAGVAGLGQIFKASVDSVDALNDVADATGSTIENISALEDTAARTGTGMDTVTTALVKFNGILKEAKPGSGQEEILKSIGLSAKELRDQDPAEALLEVAKALSQYEDDGKKARLVQELFGKSAKELAPLLKDLAEKGKLVATVTTEQAAEAEKFNKQLFEMQTNAAQAGRAISIDLVTALNSSIKEFEAGRKAAGGWLDAILLIGTTSPFNSVSENIREYSKELADLEAQKKAMGGLELMVRGENVDKEIQKAKTRLAYFREMQAMAVDTANAENEAERRRLGLSISSKPSAPNIPDTSGAKARGAKIADLAKQQEVALSSLSEQLRNAGGDMTEFDRVVDRVTNGAWSKFSDTTKAAALAIAGEIDEAKEFVEQKKAVEAMLVKAAAASDNYIESLHKELSAMQDSNATLAQQVQEIGLTTDQLSALKLARMDETIAQEQATLATAAANGLSYEEISALEQKIELLKKQRELTAQSQVAQAAADSKKDADAASKDFADTMRNDLKGAFSAAFRDTSGDPLKAFGDALENMMFTRAATALSEAAMEGLGSIIGNLGGSYGAGIGDLIGNLLSFDGGGSTGSGARSGGLDGKGGFLSILHPQETVLDHSKGQTAGAGGGISITQNISIDSRSDQATIISAMQEAKRQTLAAIQQSRRAGGAYA